MNLFDVKNEDEGNFYTKNKENIQYVPKLKTMPDIFSLLNTTKYHKLMKEIEESTVSENEKEFLRLAATRHIVFYYETVAEYYCHASPEMQDLMEKSALVILDFDDALQNDYVSLKQHIKELRDEN